MDRIRAPLLALVACAALLLSGVASAGSPSAGPPPLVELSTGSAYLQTQIATAPGESPSYDSLVIRTADAVLGVDDLARFAASWASTGADCEAGQKNYFDDSNYNMQLKTTLERHARLERATTRAVTEQRARAVPRSALLE